MKKSIIGVCLSVVPLMVFGQKKVQKKITKMETAIQQGKLRSALKTNESLLHTQNLTPEASIQATLANSRILVEMGRPLEYERSLKDALQKTETVFKDSAVKKGTVYLTASEIYLKAGYPRKAAELIQLIRKIARQSPTISPVLDGRFHFQAASVQLKLGYFTSADSLAKLSLPLLERRIVNAEQRPDLKEKNTLIKLSKQELLSRKLAYGAALSLRAEIAWRKGLYKKADSLFLQSNKWLVAQVGSKNEVLSENYLHMGEMEEEAGNIKQAESYYSKSFNAVKIRQDAAYFKAFEKMIYGKMLKDNFLSTPTKSLTQLERKTNLYQHQQNVYFAEKKILEEWFKTKKYQSDKAEERLDKLLKNNAYYPSNHPARLAAQQVYLLVDSKNENWKSVEDTLLASLTVMKELAGENSPVYHTLRIQLADFYYKKANQIKKAEELYQESFLNIVRPEMAPSHLKYVSHHNDLGSLYALGDNYPKAEKQFQIALQQAAVNSGIESPSYALVISNLASVYLGMGNYQQAREMFSKAESILNKGETDTYPAVYAVAYQNISEGYSTFGLFDKARKALKKSDQIMDQNIKRGVDVAENSTRDDLASFYLNTGNYKEAEKMLKQSIADKEKSKGPLCRELIKPLNLLGKLYYTTGDYSQSMQLLNRATSLSTTILGDSSLRFAESLKIMRKLYVAFGDYEKAAQATTRQMAITTRILGKNNLNMADALADLALIRYNLGAGQAQCRSMLKESNQMLREQLGAENPFYINGLKTLASFEIETDQLQTADSLLRLHEAYWINVLGKDNSYTAETDLLKGDVYRKHGQYDQAVARYQHALGLYRKTFSEHHPDYVRTLSKLARTHYAKGEYKNALSFINTATGTYYEFISRYFPVMSFGEKSKYWESIKSDFEFFNSLALKLKDQNPDLIDQMYNYELATKALLLSNSIKVRQRILTSGNEVLIARFNQWIEKKEAYTRAISYSVEQLKENGIHLATLEKELEELEKQLSTSSEDFAQSFEKKSFTWKDVRKTLKTGEAAIEIVRFRFYKKNFTDSVLYAALIVTAETGNHPEIVVFPNGNELETKYGKYYRNTIKFKNEDDVAYEAFWKPLEAKLKNVNTIYLSNDGAYHQINAETLRDAEGNYLIDKYTFVLLSNTKDLVLNKLYEKKNKIRTPDATIALVGNPQFYLQTKAGGAHPISALSGAEAEAQEISELYKSNKWKNNLLTRAQADEEKVKALIGTRIMHFATHAYFQPDPNEGHETESSSMKKHEVNAMFRSGLLLAGAGDLMGARFSLSEVNSQNGILTSYEAMNMNLEGTELVTLSACETALGDMQIGEGVAGLQSAFLTAGADNVIMSLFKVSDEVTEKLMLGFYKKWIATGNKRKAFTETKREIKKQYPESIYWGSFIMIGIN